MSERTMTLTRTVLRFTKDGSVVREVVVEPFLRMGPSLSSMEKLSYLASLAEKKPSALYEELKLPPYIRLNIPPPPSRTDERNAWRILLVAEVGKLLDPHYRRGLLIRYLETWRDSIIKSAAALGVDEEEAELLFNKLITEVKRAKSLEEVQKYEAMDPVAYITGLSTTIVKS